MDFTKKDFTNIQYPYYKLDCLPSHSTSNVIFLNLSLCNQVDTHIAPIDRAILYYVKVTFFSNFVHSF